MIGECKDHYYLSDGRDAGKATKETIKLESGDKIMGVQGKLYSKDHPGNLVAF